MNILPIEPVLQKYSDCGVCAAFVVGKYFFPELTYEKTLKFADKRDLQHRFWGTYSGTIGLILNDIGFHKVTIYSSDLSDFDYSLDGKPLAIWIRHLKQVKSHSKSKHDINGCDNMIKFLRRRKYNNKVILDYDFKKHIKRSIDKGLPVLISINWTKMLKESKYTKQGTCDPIGGHLDEHRVVVVGYNSHSVCIIDSNLCRYKTKIINHIDKGVYTIKWEYLIAIMAQSDMHVAEI